MSDSPDWIQWKKDFQKLEDDVDSLREYFNNNRKCRCNIETCKHFKKVLTEVLGERINKSFQKCGNINFNTFISIQKGNTK